MHMIYTYVSRRRRALASPPATISETRAAADGRAGGHGGRSEGKQRVRHWTPSSNTILYYTILYYHTLCYAILYYTILILYYITICYDMLYYITI